MVTVLSFPRPRLPATPGLAGLASGDGQTSACKQEVYVKTIVSKGKAFHL